MDDLESLFDEPAPASFWSPDAALGESVAAEPAAEPEVPAKCREWTMKARDQSMKRQQQQAHHRDQQREQTQALETAGSVGASALLGPVSWLFGGLFD